ncbi:MAG: hypothetical protein J6D28_03385 [Bacilli bacterium]|nr:hypothetical protein [Bacilli bacterium]
MNSIMRFLKNKNTVTVLGLLVIVAMLWGVYYWQLQKQVKPTSVPVASVTIQPRTQITADMIKYIDVPESYIPENAITDEAQLLQMYSHYNTVIPAGSMFYTDALTTEEAMPNYILGLLKEGETAITFTPDSEDMGYGIMPNDKIDLYMRVTTEEGSVMFGKLVENVEVLQVLDGSNLPVYEVNDGSRTPEKLIFGLQEDIFLLLYRSQFLDIDLVPVQHGKWKDDTNAKITLTTQELIDYIKARTVQLSTDPVNSGQIQKTN